MMKRLLLAIAFCLIGAPAFAATCSVVSPQLKDNTPQTFNAPYVDDGTGTGDCQPKIAQGLAGAAAAAWYEQIIQGGAALSATNGLYVLPTTSATWAVTGTFWPYTLGQQLAASSVPVVLTAAQLTTLTPPAWSNSNQIGNTGFNATLQATPTTAIGKVDPNTIATWGLAGVGLGTAPTNAQIGGLQCDNGTLTPTAGQTAALQGDANCYLEVNVKTATGVSANAAVSGITGSAIQGDALSAEPSAATTAHTVWPWYDLTGKAVTSPYAPRELQLRCAVTITASTSATTCTGMGAQGASVKIYITDLCISRSDAGTTADVVTLNDSATTIVDVPNNGGGGGFCHTYNVPLVVAANTAFQLTSGTSITSVHASATGYVGY